MKELIFSILTNVWMYTIVGGVIATVVGGYLLKRLMGAENVEKRGVTINNVRNNLVTAGSQGLSSTENSRDETAMIIGYKKTAKILFIDNDVLRDKIRGLKNAGWENISQIKDVENIDSSEIYDAEIIFVDYKGIGNEEKEQGLAVISALKARYGEEKWFILFTAYNVPVTAFEKGANDYLAKNSGTYETEQKIIKGLRKLRK